MRDLGAAGIRNRSPGCSHGIPGVAMLAWRMIRQETTAHQNSIRAQLMRGNRLARAAAREHGAERHPRLRRRGDTGDDA